MKLNFNFGRMLLPRYVIVAMLPYVLLSLVLLTAILFAQQAARFAEIVIYAELPMALLGQIGAALLPGVLIFTIPIAALAGIIVGYSRMGTDSEIVAMRAAGVGSWTMLWPALLVGLVMCAAATYIQFEEAPRAARDLERAALQGALAKLDSPVEPRTFSTLPRYVIYVRDGDKALGTWGRVFIFTQQDDKSSNVLTARSGRIDSSGDKSELVLTDVISTKFPLNSSEPDKSYVVERSDQLRVAINTGRADLVQKLNARDISADGLEMSELRERAASPDPKISKEAQRIYHRRIALAVSPLIFALLGGAVGLRIRRGGKSVGILLSLTVMIVYYLLSLLGESMSRVGTVSPFVGIWSATGFMILLSVILLVANRRRLISFGSILKPEPKTSAKLAKQAKQTFTAGVGIWGFPSLLDATLFRTLGISFLICFVALAAIFNIFTLFELWRFIAANHVGASLVARYLLFLMPLISVEMFPATMLISVLVTYALLARRHEAIAWWASGQSVYRLMLPGLLFAIAMASTSWLVQEHLMPSSNLKQDALRARIKGGEPRATTGTGRQWLASTETGRLYSYEFDNSDVLSEPTVYQLDSEGVHLSNVVTGKSANWIDRSHIKINDAQVISLKGLEVEHTASPDINVDRVEAIEVFKPTIDKPSQLSSVGLTSYLNSAKQRGADVSALAVALQRKYAAPFGILIMALVGMPLAVSFGRKGTVIALCIAVGVSIAYWAVGGGFQQLGNYGLLRPSVAGWSPLLIFAAAGTYFLSRVRT